MNRDSIQDSTRYVVGGVHQGSVIPGTRMEMWRDVYLVGGADVRGGVFCGSLSVQGPNVSVSESVYCRGAARVTSGDNPDPAAAPVTFGSSFASPDSLVVEDEEFKVRFLADLNVGQLNLANAFVYGNVFADRAVIRNSIVLGGIFCKNRLVMENSMASTFDAGRVQIGEGNYLLLPYAVARREMDMRAPVTALTFYSLYRQPRGGAGETVALDNRDIVKLDIPADSDEGEPRRIYCLSMLDRLLDSQPLANHLVMNRKLIERLVLQDKMAPGAQSETFKESVAELEALLWDTLANGATSAGQRAGVDIAQLFSGLMGRSESGPAALNVDKSAPPSS